MRHPGDLIVKDPDSIEPEGFNWTAWLAELGAGVTVQASAWSVIAPVGDLTPITLTGDAITGAGLLTQVTLSGGTVGRRYTLTNHITTSTSVVDDRSFQVLVAQR